MLMKQNVNNDVTKDSHIRECSNSKSTKNDACAAKKTIKFTFETRLPPMFSLKEHTYLFIMKTFMKVVSYQIFIA